MRLQIVAAAWLLFLAASLKANALLSMAVSTAQSFEPTNLTMRVRVEPDDVNRALEVDVPGGDYDVRGALIGSVGNRRAAVRQHVTVIDPAATGATP